MKPQIASSERDGEYYAERLKKHIEKFGGCYAIDESGTFNVIIENRRIRLDPSRDNHELNALVLEVCGQTTLSRAMQAAVQRLQIIAKDNLSTVKVRRFSALSEDGNRLYIPTASGELLNISGDGLDSAQNGFNQDSIWLEHPCGAPLEENYTSEGYELFERLLVDTQSCAVDAMRWFVAMNEGLFCLIRDSTPARFITEHIGPSQSGKTTGAQRFTLLHGLGDVKGDYSVATLGNIGDIGLLVMDNKEQVNFKQDFVDYLLFLATGAERGRSHVDGRIRQVIPGRPLGVLTTIEGVVRPELRNRVVEVHYERKGKPLGRTGIESEIRNNRHQILSALVLVLREYFELRGQSKSPEPLDSFEEHFACLCDLLRAYEAVTGKPDGWSEAIIADWVHAIGEVEPDEDDLEYPIIRVIDNFKHSQNGYGFVMAKITYEAQTGSLYIIDASRLLGMMHELNIHDSTFPQNAAGLGRRLSDAKSRFRQFQFLPTDTEGIPELKRKGERRPFGFFFPDDS